MRTTLRNDFHGTETRINAKDGDQLDARRIRSIKQRLCPGDTCQCSNPLGMRGQQGLGALDLDVYRARMGDLVCDVIEA